MDYSVLIIDDDIWMQRILSKTLQSYGFNTSYLAANAFEGIDMAIEYKPTLIIMDILMPELSGQVALKILKSIKITKNIPVLMVSAMSDTENLGMAVKSGTAGFISKPFTRSTVYEKLLSIFGKEKLDLIARGEPIDNEMDLIVNEMSNQKDESLFLSKTNVRSTQRNEPDPGLRSINSYKENDLNDKEDKNLESIKRLLQKARR